MKQVVVTLCSLSLVGGLLLLLSLSMSLSMSYAAETALTIHDEEAATKDDTASTAVQHGPPSVPSPRSRPRRQLQVQEDDAECACQPARISFQLALNQTCDPTAADAAVATGQIVDYECTIEKLQVSNSTGGGTVKNVTTGTGSAVPAVVVSVLILELDANDQIIGQSATNGTFVNGDIIEFQSTVATESASASSSLTRPTSLLVVMRGHATIDDASASSSAIIINTFLIAYSTECLLSTDSSPLLTVGQPLGWFLVVRGTAAGRPVSFVSRLGLHPTLPRIVPVASPYQSLSLRF
jgi:hypothetical protein